MKINELLRKNVKLLKNNLLGAFAALVLFSSALFCFISYAYYLPSNFFENNISNGQKLAISVNVSSFNTIRALAQFNYTLTAKASGVTYGITLFQSDKSEYIADINSGLCVILGDDEDFFNEIKINHLYTGEFFPSRYNYSANVIWLSDTIAAALDCQINDSIFLYDGENTYEYNTVGIYSNMNSSAPSFVVPFSSIKEWGKAEVNFSFLLSEDSVGTMYRISKNDSGLAKDIIDYTTIYKGMLLIKFALCFISIILLLSVIACSIDMFWSINTSFYRNYALYSFLGLHYKYILLSVIILNTSIVTISAILGVGGMLLLNYIISNIASIFLNFEITIQSSWVGFAIWMVSLLISSTIIVFLFYKKIKSGGIKGVQLRDLRKQVNF